MNPPAGFWRRYAAYSLDAVLIGGLALPLLWSRLRAGSDEFSAGLEAMQWRLWELFDQSLMQPDANPLALANQWAADPALRAGIEALVSASAGLMLHTASVCCALAAVWFIAGEASPWQASPGKRLFGLRVTDRAGARPGAGRIVLRFVAGAPSWLLLNLGHAMAAWTPGKRALHDYLAGTRVELAPGAATAMPRGARGWLVAQAVAFMATVGFIVLRYLQLLWAVAEGGLP
jgi:uncharacterized RDD family membrane protein YckC